MNYKEYVDMSLELHLFFDRKHISPHKIILSNPLKNLLIMHYADYIQNDDLYFIDGESEPLTMSKLRNYIKDYF